MDENEKKESPPSFAAQFAAIRPGTDVEAGETLARVIEQVKVTGKVGSLILRVDVKPADGGIEAVVVTDKLTAKVPEKSRVGSLAFITENNSLSRTDPSAMPLFTDEDIRDAGADPRTGEIKEVDGA